MKRNLIICSFLLLLGSSLLAQHQPAFILIVDGDSLDIRLDQEFTIASKKGPARVLKLVQPDILKYEDEMISFEYPKQFGVSSSVIQEGIEQFVVMSSTGNGYMIQEYSTMNPSGLSQLMITELTKESINYGYSKQQEVFTKELPGGQILEGLRATLTYNDEKEIYTVATYGKKDQGILIVTMVNNEEYMESDGSFIELFMDTLQVVN